MLTVAAVFFLGNLHNHHERISWMKREKQLVRVYLAMWGFEVAWFFLPFAILLTYTFNMCLRGIKLMADLPGGNQALEVAVAGEVSSLLDAFAGYIGHAAIAIPVWILFLLGLPALSDYYVSLKKAVDRTHNDPRMVEFMYKEAMLYLADKTGEGPASGDLLDWARREWAKGENSPFYVYLQTRISGLVDNSTQTEKEILNWTVATLLVLFAVLFLVAVLVG